MMEFKFLNKNRVFSDWMDAMDDYHLGGIPSSFNSNHYLGFDMDRALILAIKYLRDRSQFFIGNDLSLQRLNFPISNTYIRILRWNTYSSPDARIDISYRIIHNAGYEDYTYTSLIIDFQRMIE